MQVVAVLLIWQFRRSLTGLVALLLGIFLFELIQPVAIASVGDLDRLQGILDLVPPSFLALLNVTPEFLGGAGLAGYLSLGFSHPVYHLLAGATVIWFACRGLAGEVERGSIQIALSRAVSRRSVYFSRLIGVVIVGAVVAVIGPLGMIVGIAIGEPAGSIRMEYLFIQGIASALLLWAIGGAGLLISASASRMGQAIGWSIGLLVVSYVIDYFADLWGALEPIKPFSLFDYYDPPAAMTRGEITGESVLVMGTVALVGALSGLVVFSRRDLP